MKLRLQLSLTTKVFLAFASLLAIFALLAYYSVREVGGVGEDLRRATEGHLSLARLVGQLETFQQNRFRDLRRSISEHDPRSQELILRIASAYFPDVIRWRVVEASELCARQIEKAEREPGPAGKAIAEFYRGIAARIEHIRAQHEALDDLTDQMLRAVKAGESLRRHEAALDRGEQSLRTETYELSRQIGDQTDRAVKRAAQDERDALWRVLAVTLLAVLVGIMLTVLASRALTPIGELVRFARAISRGDYTQRVQLGGGDELAALALELQSMARSRKEREEELDRQQDELEKAYHRVDVLKRYHESVVQSLETAILVTDRNLLITSTNRMAEDHFGLGAESALGRPLTALPLGRALAREVSPLAGLLERDRPVGLDGLKVEERLCDVSITPFRDEAGRVLGLVVALVDVTEAVQTKEALIRSERLAAIGRMSAHVTHEIRNPLSSIGLNTELLAELIEGHGPEARTLCQSIGREIDRLTAITEAYLKFARLPRPELEPVDLIALLKNLAGFVTRDCQAAGVAIALELPETLPAIALDTDQIRQALLNLVRNAKESMPEGGTLTLGARAESGRIEVEVRDTGVGIAAENLERIFDPFFSSKLTGTGLGLALTQQIVTEHGGSLSVKTRVGLGSSFIITLSVRPPRRARDAGSSSPRLTVGDSLQES